MLPLWALEVPSLCNTSLETLMFIFFRTSKKIVMIALRDLFNLSFLLSMILCPQDCMVELLVTTFVKYHWGRGEGVRVERRGGILVCYNLSTDWLCR